MSFYSSKLGDKTTVQICTEQQNSKQKVTDEAGQGGQAVPHMSSEYNSEGPVLGAEKEQCQSWRNTDIGDHKTLILIMGRITR